MASFEQYRAESLPHPTIEVVGHFLSRAAQHFAQMINPFLFHIKKLSDVCKKKLLIAEGNECAISPSSVLLEVSCPSAISLIVSKVWIYSVQSKFWRTFAHVRDKIMEGIFPTVTHRYSATAPILEPYGIWIVASAFGSKPSAVSSGSRFSMLDGCPVGHRLRFLPSASTANDRAIPDAIQSDDFDLSAIARKLPKALLSFGWRWRNGSQTPVSLSRYIDFCWHRKSPIPFTICNLNGWKNQ